MPALHAFRADVLIQPKEVRGIVVRLDLNQSVPALTIGLGHAVILIATHEIHINTRAHGWTKPAKEISNPPNVSAVLGSLRPVCQEIHDEG